MSRSKRSIKGVSSIIEKLREGTPLSEIATVLEETRLRGEARLTGVKKPVTKENISRHYEPLSAIVAEETVTDSLDRMTEMFSVLKSYGDALSEVCQKMATGHGDFIDATGEFIKEVRDRRMSLRSELVAMSKTIVDLKDMLDLMNSGNGLTTLRELVQIGKDLRDAFGEEGAERLATALLTVVETRRE